MGTAPDVSGRILEAARGIMKSLLSEVVRVAKFSTQVRRRFMSLLAWLAALILLVLLGLGVVYIFNQAGAGGIRTGAVALFVSSRSSLEILEGGGA